MTERKFYWSNGGTANGYSTGVRLFFILLLAMAPLSFIAFFATIEIDRNAMEARQDAAENALNLSAFKLHNSLEQLQNNLAETSRRPASTALCDKFIEENDPESFDGALFFNGASEEPVCRIGLIPEDIIRQILLGSPEALHISNNQNGLILNAYSKKQRVNASIFVSSQKLLNMADAGDNLPLSDLRLHIGNDDLLLKRLPIRRENRLQEQMIAPQSVLGMQMALRLPKPVSISPNYFIRLLLVMMTVFAAMIGWIIVNRMLLQPLKALQRKMHNFSPGAPVSALPASDLRAPEIAELNTVFDHLAAKVNDDKGALAKSLDGQIKLTREVHHRVKNNLQIVSSLLNLHSRGIDDVRLKDHYAMIQRRVDALAVVHRNHSAQGEAVNGIAVRPLVNEIVASFRSAANQDIISRIKIVCGDHQIEQDIAMPVAFLLTELLEVMITLDANKSPETNGPETNGPETNSNNMSITIAQDTPSQTLRLTLSSPVLIGNAAIAMLAEPNIKKIITGLTRQLRSDLIFNHENGRIAMDIPYMVPGITMG